MESGTHAETASCASHHANPNLSNFDPDRDAQSDVSDHQFLEVMEEESAETEVYIAARNRAKTGRLSRDLRERKV